MRTIVILATAAAALLFHDGSMAADSEVNQCRINVTPVHFGTYNPFARTDARANGVVSYNCTVGTPVSIGLDRSQGGAFATRVMRQGAHSLEYNLYLDAACTLVWGDGTAGTQIYRDPAPRPDSNISVPIYGCLPAGQRGAVVGPYQETLAVTINF